MKIILKQDMGKTGSLGDEIDVKPGFARNYLIPKGFAIQITRNNEKFIRHHRDHLESKRKEAIERNKSLAEQLKNVHLKFTMPAGKNGKLFGSVTSKMVVDEITALGIDVEKKNFYMGAGIKQTGTHKVPVKLHSQVSVNITVNIVSEASVRNAPITDAEEATPANDSGEKPNEEITAVNDSGEKLSEETEPTR